MLIEVKNLTKSYASKKACKTVLNDVNLLVETGEKVAIMGASGCGKTTLLNILGGLETPTSGEYFYNSKLVLSSARADLSNFRRTEIGFVSQGPLLINQVNVFKNIALPLEIRNDVDVKSKVYKIADLLNIHSLLEMKPNRLSVGECQRILVARAVITKPKLILADEPTSALDKANKKCVLDVFHNLQQEGATIIIVTHDSAVANYCDRSLTFMQGSIY